MKAHETIASPTNIEVYLIIPLGIKVDLHTAYLSIEVRLQRAERQARDEDANPYERSNQYDRLDRDFVVHSYVHVWGTPCLLGFVMRSQG
jgi:hypothetical protein